MVWACFAYGWKEPIYFWFPETAAERNAADEALHLENLPIIAETTKREAAAKVKRAAEQSLLPKGHKKRGRPPVIRPRLLKREKEKGGVDWYRYRRLLRTILEPAYHELQRVRPTVIFQQDNAAPHVAWQLEDEFKRLSIECLDWPANSPDLSAIEPGWSYIKRRISKRRPPITKRADSVAAWREEWEMLPMERINAWVGHVPELVNRCIAVQGNNTFHG
jgi:hypothetical protein